jgi:hypothetical protein
MKRAVTPPSHIYDSRYSEDRRFPGTRYTIFILPLRRPDSTGSFRFRTGDSRSVRTETLSRWKMQNVPVVDQPRWPALDSIATPARMTFKMVWKSTGEPVKYDDSSRHFRFTGTRASCQLEVQVEVPSIGFLWKSDPLNTVEVRLRHSGR